MELISVFPEWFDKFPLHIKLPILFLIGIHVVAVVAIVVYYYRNQKVFSTGFKGKLT